ncbi:MAG: sulfurtransferase [Geobacteraceae bacterium]|nr:sulfurtransferase [Geobacteraceae bacterium]
MNSQISCKELYQWLTEEKDFTIIDVLPPEYYASRHIPGAVNVCVYEMTFLDSIREKITDKKRSIVVYDSSNRSKASLCAVEKLSAAGFAEVFELAGGIEEWEGSGYPVDVLGPDMDEEPVPSDGTHPIDCGTSRLEWIGRNVFKKHWGTIDISGGEIIVANGVVAGGSVTMDMRSIKDCDLADESLNALLIRHLTSDDFFDVENHPTASFQITQCVPEKGATPGMPNYLVKGMLTIKGIAQEVAVPAIIVPGESSGIHAQACFSIDRTQWNITYGSGKLFEKLGMHLVNDTISLELFISAR